jgi:hypothetical protein
MMKLITEEFEALFENYPLYSQEHEEDPLVIAKLFDPAGFALARSLRIAGAISRTIDTRIFSRTRDRFRICINELQCRNQSVLRSVL